MNKIMIDTYISNIQKFLNKFQISNNLLLFNSETKVNSRVFVYESQLPDMWIKTRTPIDRNKMFYTAEDRKKGGPRKVLNNIYGDNVKREPVYFPSVPLIIPNESLNSKGIKLEKLPLEKLFQEGISNDDIEKEHIIMNSFSQEEISMNDILEKTWFLSFYHDKKNINYGPMSSYKIYLFLKNMYSKMPQIEKEKKCFMVVDFICDIHFQPDTLYDVLTEAFKNKINHTELKEDPIKINYDNSNLQFANFGKFRRLNEGERILNKNSNSQKAFYQPFSKFDLNWRKGPSHSYRSDERSTKYSSLRSEENNQNFKDDYDITVKSETKQKVQRRNCSNFISLSDN